VGACAGFSPSRRRRVSTRAQAPVADPLRQGAFAQSWLHLRESASAPRVSTRVDRRPLRVRDNRRVINHRAARARFDRDDVRYRREIEYTRLRFETFGILLIIRHIAALANGAINRISR